MKKSKRATLQDQKLSVMNIKTGKMKTVASEYDYGNFYNCNIVMYASNAVCIYVIKAL